ncbi:MAG TPA: ATP-binding cassette domain-containing protein, partial [Mycobacterium sp.]
MNATRPASGTLGSRSLRPGELAQSSVMAALCAATAIISIVVPFAGALSLLGTVPMGLLAYRYRFRVLIAGAVAAGLIAFLIAGLGGLMTVGNSAYVGGLTGVVKRRQRGTGTVIVVSILAGAVFNAFAVAALALLSRLRHLIFDAITANINGVAAVLTGIARFVTEHPFPLSGRIGDGLDRTAHGLQWFLGEALHYWPWLIFANGMVSIVVVSLIGWWALSRVLNRMRGVPDVHKLDALPDTAPIGPVPVRLCEVRFRYPNTDHDALRPVNLEVKADEHLAITGANGSGKTTLMLVLAGREPTSGTIERPGSVGLGRLGGTAIVMQHPESQVLGTRVADDVVWGLPPGTTTDVAQLLREVGLESHAERDTG